MKEKSVLGLICGLGSYLVGSINMVTIVFFLFMGVDFLTGIIGSRANGEMYDKRKAEVGVYKKLGYLIFWVLGVLVQLIIQEQGKTLGIDLAVPIVSLAVTFWLLGTEGISILNNLYKMGVRGIPSWFITYFDRMKTIKENTERREVTK